MSKDNKNTNKNIDKTKNDPSDIEGWVTIPIKNGYPDFESVTGVMKLGANEEPLSHEKCIGIISLGYQYFQTMLAARQVLLLPDE